MLVLRRSCSIPGCYAFGTSVRVWDCAGRSYPSHSAPREKSSSMMGARLVARTRRGHPALCKLALVACWYGLVPQKGIAKAGIFGW